MVINGVLAIKDSDNGLSLLYQNCANQYHYKKKIHGPVEKLKLKLLWYRVSKRPIVIIKVQL